MPPPLRQSARETVTALACSLALWLTACVSQGGDWSRTTSEPEENIAPATLRLVLIGDAGAAGRSATAVATRIKERLEESQKEGINSALIWLGDSTTATSMASKRGCSPTGSSSASRTKRIRAFAELAEEHRAAGGLNLSTVGELDWRCGLTEFISSRHAGDPGMPCDLDSPSTCLLRQPSLNYIIRLDRQGSGRVVSSCGGEPVRCAIEADDGSGVIDLVVIDSAAWLDPPTDDSSAVLLADRSLAEERGLLAALRRTPKSAGPPRLLVSHHPIESSGPHGQGGLWPDSAYFFHDQALQDAISAGSFAGVLSGHDHSLQVSSDLTPAVQRSSRVWLPAPVFQVVSGSAGRGDAGRGPRSWSYYQGISATPEQLSDHPGFAELTITESRFIIVLHARRRGRWWTATTTIPRQRDAPTIEAPTPGLEPCLGCDTRSPRVQALDPEG
ncbi:MAG TPA: hypothetical protein ENJ18_04650 [Nannocystis exedens]|nr:hypothetical protein [Nannocystis exedens]